MLQVHKTSRVILLFDSATILGYDQWENRPTLSGGPLKGEYQLVEVHWEMMDLIMNAFFSHYGHTINGARYDFEVKITYYGAIFSSTSFIP